MAWSNQVSSGLRDRLARTIEEGLRLNDLLAGVAPELPADEEEPASPTMPTDQQSRRAAGLRPSGAACANRPGHTGPALRCRPLAVGPALTVWYFFLLLLHFGKIPWPKFDKNSEKFWQNLLILEEISKHFSNFR